MTTPAELCAQLKPAREAQQRQLEDLALETGLPVEYLAALEDGRLDLLPDPAYARIYFVNYARALGLDVEELVMFWPAPTRGAPAVRKSPGRSVVALWRVPAAVVVVAAAAWFVYRWVQGGGLDSRTVEEPTLDVHRAVAADSVSSAMPEDSPFVEPESVVVEDTAQAVVGADQPPAQRAESPQPAPPVAVAPVSAAPLRTLEVKTRVQMWIVIEADGDTVKAGLFPAGASVRAQANSWFALTAGRPSEISVYLDGEALAMPAERQYALVRHRIDCREGDRP